MGLASPVFIYVHCASQTDKKNLKNLCFTLKQCSFLQGSKSDVSLVFGGWKICQNLTVFWTNQKKQSWLAELEREKKKS